MPSPFKVNESLVPKEKLQRVFMNIGENKPKEDNTKIDAVLDKKMVNLLLDLIPPIRNHLDRFFNQNDPEDIQTMADLEQLYQELIEIKKEFQKQKEE